MLLWNRRLAESPKGMDQRSISLPFTLCIILVGKNLGLGNGWGGGLGIPGLHLLV